METKFRVWKHYSAQMEYFTLEDLLHFDEYDRKRLFDSNISKEMQYLELKDINGQELYDKDIIEHWGETYTCEFEDIIYHKMNSGIFDGDFKIIGNVYENRGINEVFKNNTERV